MNVEDRAALPIEYSPTINKCIKDQQVTHLAYNNRAFAGTDPHKGLKDVFSDEEIVKLVNNIWRLRGDSLDLIFSYTWGKNAGLRGASSRKMTLSDLNVSYGFGPELTAPRNRTLLLVLRKGTVHKDKHTTDKQVGVQRHRDYRQCSVFATAALLIMKLRSLENRIHFLRHDPNERAEWWDIPLNEFSNYSEESNAMRHVLAAAGLDLLGSKVTHHRTQAVQYAGSRGLQPWQVCTFTKHITEKFHSAYQPEVEEESMRVMSGFRKHESRFVPTEHVVFPGNQEAYLEEGINFLIPHYQRYIQEYNSQHGDRCQASTKMLFHVIPYLVETLLQCGYFFIKDFPNHPLTAILRVSKSWYNFK